MITIGSVVDAVVGITDTVTGGIFDLSGQKKDQKKLEKQIKEREAKAKADEEREKKKQLDSQKDFYEGLRYGNLGLLKPKNEQTIG